MQDESINLKRFISKLRQKKTTNNLRQINNFYMSLMLIFTMFGTFNRNRRTLFSNKNKKRLLCSEIRRVERNPIENCILSFPLLRYTIKCVFYRTKMKTYERFLESS